MILKKKSKLTKALIAASFLIVIVAIITPVNACYTNRIYIIAIGDDMDLPSTSNFIIGNIKLSGESKPESAGVFFYSRIYDESGKYAMTGMTINGILVTDQLGFYCPVCDVFFVNVWWFQGEGIFRTTDTNIDLLFRKMFPIIMPNTKGEYITTSIFMWLSPTGEYYDYEGVPGDPNNPPHPIGSVKIWPEGGWVIVGVFWDVGIPGDVGFGEGILPIGPLSYLTKSLGI